VAGALLGAFALGLIGRDYPWGHTPRWVVGAAGVLFATGGFVPLASSGRVSSRTGQWMGLLMAIALAAVFHWIAFGPGTRQFSGSSSVLGIPIGSANPSERNGRIVFGTVAVLLDLCLVLGAWRLLTGRSGRDNDG
jgi:hypothetical protein